MSLVLAVGRGRVLESVQGHLRELGMPLPQAGQISATSGGRTLLVVRSWDVPTFVSEGAADIGITGADIVRENDHLDLYQPLDLDANHCRLVIATPDGAPLPPRARIATRFVRMLDGWMREHSVEGRCIPLQGALEEAPRLGLADAIMDQTQSGKSLADHGLVAVHEVMSSTASVIVNKASARTRMAEVDELLARLAELDG